MTKYFYDQLGVIYKGNTEVVADDANPLWKEYENFLKSGGTVEPMISGDQNDNSIKLPT